MLGEKGDWRGVTVARKCGSPHGGVKCIRKTCQLMETCDGHGGGVIIIRKCDSCQGSVKDIQKV